VLYPPALGALHTFEGPRVPSARERARSDNTAGAYGADGGAERQRPARGEAQAVELAHAPRHAPEHDQVMDALGRLVQARQGDLERRRMADVARLIGQEHLVAR